MNVYDPADRMVYVHLSGRAADRTPSAADFADEHLRLPAAYADRSPRTPGIARSGQLLQARA